MEESELNNELKKNPFRMPEGYFESFDDKVLARLNKGKSSFSVWRNVKKWSIAAVVFLAAGLGVFVYNQRTPDTIDLANVAISETELLSFQEEVEVSDDEFMELLNTQAVDSIYHLEVLSVGNAAVEEEAIEWIDEEYSPLEDEIEI